MIQKPTMFKGASKVVKGVGETRKHLRTRNIMVTGDKVMMDGQAILDTKIIKMEGLTQEMHRVHAVGGIAVTMASGRTALRGTIITTRKSPIVEDGAMMTTSKVITIKGKLIAMARRSDYQEADQAPTETGIKLNMKDSMTKPIGRTPGDEETNMGAVASHGAKMAMHIGPRRRKKSAGRSN